MQKAVVKRILDSRRAEVQTEAEAACAQCGGQGRNGDVSCVSCNGSGRVRHTVQVIALNTAHAQQGDHVELGSMRTRIKTAASIVYMLPFALFFAGYGLSWREGGEQQALVTGAAVFAVGMLLAYAFHMLVSRRKAPAALIRRILPRPAPGGGIPSAKKASVKKHTAAGGRRR